MRNKVTAILLIFSLILCMSGCRPLGKESEEEILANAKTVHDVKSLMTNTSNEMIYSELRNAKALYYYFDLLGRDEYIKVKHKGKDYLLVWYYYYSYKDYFKEVHTVTKTFRGEELKIHVDVKKEEFPDDGGIGGCFPSLSRVRLILKLDKAADLIYLMDKPVTGYKGGHVKIAGNEGVLDKDLNFVLPPVYKGIFDLTQFQDTGCPMYYRVYKDGHNGVLDDKFNQVLDKAYGNIYYINENKFIVGISDEDPKNDEIAIVDGKGNIIRKMKGFLCANDDIRLHTAEGHIRICDPSFGDIWGNGIIDTDLNVIIEPVYQEIFWKKSFYQVTDFDDIKTDFDTHGKKI